MKRSPTYEIEVGPAGREIGAFFDLDGTVVAGFSALALLRDRLMGGRFSIRGIAELGLGAIEYRQGAGFAALLTALAKALEGTSERDLVAAGRRVFREQLAASIFPDVRSLIQAHQAKGHSVAIVTAATRYQAEPIARDLGVKNVVCTRFEVEDGKFTGSIRGKVCYAEGKREAARAFSKRRQIDLGKSYFYTDGVEDVPLLEVVRHPRPTNPDKKLSRTAEERGWPTRSYAVVEPANLMEIARTTLLASLIPSAVGALALGSRVADSEPRVRELTVRSFGAVAEWLAGIDVRVSGEAHLPDAPVVYVFNHASAVDLLLVARVVAQPTAALLRGRGESIWVRSVPTLYAGSVVLEPQRGTSRRALEPAISLLREGTSLAAAPEDASTPSPRLTSFRLAPFVAAREAGVPIVPLVIHNSQAVLPNGALCVRPGVVDIEVLAPIPTSGWQANSLRRHVDAVHRKFARALAR